MSSFDKALESLSPQESRQWHELKIAHWKSVQTAVTKLFQQRKYPDLAADLPELNEKLSKLSRSEIGQFIGDFYQDQILKRCMIILRQEVVEEKGSALLRHLADIWTQFYTSILPTLLAIFAPVQPKDLSVRALTLISFRDIVLLKTDIADALEHVSDPPPQIKQMLLVLQSVHRVQPTDQFFELQDLVKRVVDPYLCMVSKAHPKSSELQTEGFSKRSSRAETVHDLDSTTKQNLSVKETGASHRRHSFGNSEKENSPTHALSSSTKLES